jgi:hypothetical protein
LRTSQLSFTNLDSVFESDKPLKVIVHRMSLDRGE